MGLQTVVMGLHVVNGCSVRRC